MQKECVYCFNSEIYEEEEIIWCNRYDCNSEEVAKENENPSCWETLKEHDERRFNVCKECKYFWYHIPSKPNFINDCKKGKEIPNGEAYKNCNSFKPIDKTKKI